MADETANAKGGGCLWGLLLIVFLPAGLVSAAIWPDQSADAFVGRTFLIGCGLAISVALIIIMLIREGSKR